jgi:hypothetical protein
MESYKGDTLYSMQQNMSVLKDFPKQVLVLRATGEASRIDPRLSVPAVRMINKKETKAFKSFCEQLDLAKNGNSSIIRQLRERGKWADRHLDSMLEKPGEVAEVLVEFSKIFSSAELKSIRKNEEMSYEMKTKFLQLVLEIAAQARSLNPRHLKIPRFKDRWNCFIHRYAVCQAVQLLFMIQHGKTDSKPEDARNDAVDLIQCTYATYYNGIMTRDKQASANHEISRRLIRALGGRVPVNFAETA